MISERQVKQIKPILEQEAAVDRALVYLFGRSWNTPLDVLTPEDMLHRSVGVEAAHRLLEVEALTAYRTSEPPIPLHELLLPTRSRYRPGRVGATGSYWGQPWRQHLTPGLDFSPLLEFLGGGDYGGINMSDSPSVRSAVEHLCADIVKLLKGLDRRRQEYQDHLSGIVQLCRAEEAGEIDTEFFHKVSHEISELSSDLSRVEVMDISAVEAQIEVLKALPGTDGGLGKKEEFGTFAEISLAALAQRQSVLKIQRNAIKDIRDTSATLLAAHPQLKAFVEKLRARTQTALGHRYYLEGDWRGEIPQAWPGQIGRIE